MRTTRSILVVLTLSSPLTAQVAAHPRAGDLVDLAWLAPVLAQARSAALLGVEEGRVALSQAAPVLAQARRGLLTAQAAPALAGARAGLLRAQAALAGISGADPWPDSDRQSPPEAWAQQDPADQLYRDARAALNRGRYSNAAELFEQIYGKYPRSTYAGDAYYWQAYALSKRSSDDALRQALEVLRLQREKAPSAGTRGEADALRIRIQGQLARTGNADAAATVAAMAADAASASTPASAATAATAASPSSRRSRGRDRCGDEDDIQTAALNALQQMDEERALPILKKVLARRDEGSLCLRRKAVFIVSQQAGPETERILLEAARNDPDSEVREQSVFWLSQVDSPGAVAALDSILRSASDPVLQDKAIFALSQQESGKARQALRDFALRPSVSDELREKAIFWIGQSNDPGSLDFLKTLYGQLKSEALRDKILFSISQINGRGSSQWLLQVASDVNENLELRKKALFWVGQSDYPVSDLATLYDRMPNREMKEQLIFVYSQRNEKAALDRLMQIARTEQDRELKKKAIFWLGQSGDPRAAEFLASLLERP